MELFNALDTESLPKIKEIIKLKNLSLDNDFFCKVLMKAFAFERKDVVRFLLQDHHCHVDVTLKNYSFTTTPLHYAIKLRDIDLVKEILVKKPSLTKVDSNGNTPLHLAFLHKFEEAVDLILQYIEETSDYINSPNSYGLSHMHIACTRKNTKVIRGFLKAGVDTKETVNDDSPYWPGYTAFHFACDFISLEAFKLLNLEELVECKATNGTTSCQILKAHMEDLLVMSYFSKDECFDECSDIYFLIACLEEKPSLLKKFIYNDVNVNYTFYNAIFNPCENSALQVAVINDCEEAVELLLQNGANSEYTNTNAMTALHLALYNESPLDGNIIVDLLYKTLKLGDILPNVKDENGLGYFEIAVTRNDFETVEKFIERGIDVNKLIKSNEKGFSHFAPLHFAVKYKHKEMAKLLIEKGAKVDLTGEDNEYGTPLHMAFEIGDKDMIELLLKRGADAKSVRPFDGRTMLHSLVAHSDCYFINNLEKVLMYIEQLIKLGIDVNARDKRDKNVLHILCLWYQKCGACLKLLLEFGADINAEDAGGCLPFNLKQYDSRDCISDEFLIFYHHVQKLKALGLEVHPKNEKLCKIIGEDLKKLEPHRKALIADELICRERQRLDEVARLKNIMITTYTSLYDFLKLEPTRAAVYTPNDVLEEIIKEKNFDKTYPSYGYLIRLRCRENVCCCRAVNASKRMCSFGDYKESHSPKRHRFA